MKPILLDGVMYTIVDDEDFEKLNKHEWYVNKGYAIRNSIRGHGKRHVIFMHREILGLEYKDGEIADHRNRNTLDNRRANLRLVNKAGNQRNHSRYNDNTSGYNGVNWHKRDKNWRAYIMVNNKQIHLGCFSNVLDAVEARKQGELEHWGESYG